MRGGTALALTVLAACGGYSERSYRGDGTLRDHGPFSGSGRYTLDLGDVDLNTRGERRFTLANLPPERLVVGLGFRNEPPDNAKVHLRLEGADGKLIDDAGALGGWLHSSSHDYATFLWCKGVGDSWSETAGTAWGCIVKPKAGATYNLSLEVVEPAAARANGRLIVKGGPPDFLP